MNSTKETDDNCKIEVYVENQEGINDQLVLSHKKARILKSWNRVNEAFDKQEIVQGYVKSRTKGGLIVDVFGIEAFLPGSQIDVKPIRDYDVYVDSIMEFMIIEIDEESKNIVISHRRIIEEERYSDCYIPHKCNDSQTTCNSLKHYKKYGEEKSFETPISPPISLFVDAKAKKQMKGKDADKTMIKDVWRKHTEVQEQILRQRSAPLIIDSTKTEIINDKLYVSVDTSDNTQQIQKLIVETLGINDDSCHFEDGYVFAPIVNWTKIDDLTKSILRENANKEYVSFSFCPVIDGKITDLRAQFTNVKDILDNLGIDYDFDKNKRLQIAINELHKLKSDEDFNQLQISLPDTTSAIIPTYPSILYFLERFYPNHKFKNVNIFKESSRGTNDVTIKRELIVEGGYFNEEMLSKLNETFEIKMSHVEIDFKIHETSIGNYDWDKNLFGLPERKNDVLTFRKRIKDKKCIDFDFENEIIQESIEDEVFTTSFNSIYTDDIEFEYALNCRIINKIFGKGNYDVIERYFYTYKENRKWATIEELDRFNNQLHMELKNKGFGIEKNGSSIGIDFNWKEISLPEILTRLSQDYGFIDFNLYKNGHKCNFDINFKKSELANIMEDLNNSFENFNLAFANKGTELSFYKEFDSIEDLLAFKPLLCHKLSTIDSFRYSCTIFDVPADCVKLLYSYDKKSRDEDCRDAVKELRGSDFMVGDLSVGKLIRISNYPEIVIDISGDNYEITKQLFKDSDIKFIIPDLSGDLEKLARLKESLNRIVEGREIENPLLGSFIFDASKARNIEEYEDNIKLELQEISKHILNKKIDDNGPQKVAIAKVMLAPDLALIQGPPGTGKSTAIAEMIWQHTRKYPNKRILLTSETNLAVDNAIDRVVNNQHNLIKPIRIGDESRLESEGLQFSYPAMYRWAKGEDWKKKKSTVKIDDDDYEEEFANTEDLVYKAPEKLILLNWMENIGRRLDKEKMPLKVQELWKDLLENPTSTMKNLFFDNYVANCNVIGATCSSIGQKNIILSESIQSSKKDYFKPTKFYSIYKQIFNKRDKEQNPKIYFDMVIQDESSKATPAELSLPLIYGVKNVIIGDHRQLPPMLSRESFLTSFDYGIKYERNEEERQKMINLRSYVLKNFSTLEVSHFERLYNQIDSNLKGVFNYQFRMHPAINNVIKQFYQEEGGLECGLTYPKDLGVDDPDFLNNGASRYHGISAGPITPDTHVLWIDSSSPEMLDGTSRVNYGEVQIIKKLLKQLNDSESFHKFTEAWTNIEDKQIGLISFYGKQLRLLKEMTKEFDQTQIPIRVSTVDRFQGMERNIIIVSMVRSHCIQTEKNQKPNFDKYPGTGFPIQEDLGFAQSPNRLNVALSRAKRLLIIVGDSKLFRTKEIYDNVYINISDPDNINGKIITAQEYGL